MIANAMRGNDRAIERIFKLFPEQTPAELAKQNKATLDNALDSLDQEGLEAFLEIINSVMAAQKDAS
jgi:hypothetical protein